jgi:hypothetical protein
MNLSGKRAASIWVEGIAPRMFWCVGISCGVMMAVAVAVASARLASRAPLAVAKEFWMKLRRFMGALFLRRAKVAVLEGTSQSFSWQNVKRLSLVTSALDASRGACYFPQ